MLSQLVRILLHRSTWRALAYHGTVLDRLVYADRIGPCMCVRAQRQERLDPDRASHWNALHRDDCSPSSGYVREGDESEQLHTLARILISRMLSSYGGLVRETTVVDCSCAGCGAVVFYDGKDDGIFVRSTDMVFSQDIFQKYVGVAVCVMTRLFR